MEKVKVKEKGGGGEEFTIRPYTKKELALLYFPHSNPRTAVNHLKRWIHKSSKLWDTLQDLGYRASSKDFTPLEVKAIVSHLGEPG